MEVLYKYIGNGAFVNGIPARDILASETEYHDTAEANSKTSLPCYERVEAKAKVKAKDEPVVLEKP